MSRSEPAARERADVVVIGSGITGLAFALEVADRASVVVITKKAEADSNTNYARGGIAAVLGADDEPALHVRDTLDAGAGLCDPDVVEGVVREGPERIRDLLEWGVRFHRGDDGLDLGREGGHSRRRIVHAADRTGREIERALLAAAAAAGVRIVEDHLAVDLLAGSDDASGERRCAGVVALDHRSHRRVLFRAPFVLLAAGGCGQIFRHTTNPAIATGDGVAMAHRACAPVADMEFVQFHPTALFPTDDPAFLISEALRGEGALLRRIDGHAFMEAYDERRSLAPRDVVARAVHREMKRSGDDHVLLDPTPIPRDVMEVRFPAALEGCRSRGIDPFADGIPVVPAAHYACGGVRTDREGRTGLAGLFAAGEVARTGMHGANRLASNSLLEAVVFGHRAAGAVLRDLERSPSPPEIDAERWSGPTGEAPEAEVERIGAVRGRVRDLMWEKAGIVRTEAELEEAEVELRSLLEAEDGRWTDATWSLEGAELRNLVRAAWLVVACALRRKESRGLHYNLDHPERDDEAYGRPTVLDAGEPATAAPREGVP